MSRKFHLTTWITVGVSVLLLGGLGFGFYSEVVRQLPTGSEFEDLVRTQYGQSRTTEHTAVEQPVVDDDPAVGPQDAVVTIIAFEDFECPYSASVWRTEQQVLKEFEGKVQFIYRDFPISSLHPHAQEAAEAAECADDQGKFWNMHDQLFTYQKSLSTESIRTAAENAELDMAEFTTCIESGIHKDEVLADYAAGVRAGVSGTPTYFFNGIRVEGALPIDVFRQAINYFLQP